MDRVIETHRRWCGEDCTGAVTGIHTSTKFPVGPKGTEFVGITVAVEQLPETPPISLVVLELAQDGQAEQYRLPIGQAIALARALRRALGALTTLSQR